MPIVEIINGFLLHESVQETMTIVTHRGGSALKKGRKATITATRSNKKGAEVGIGRDLIMGLTHKTAAGPDPETDVIVEDAPRHGRTPSEIRG